MKNLALKIGLSIITLLIGTAPALAEEVADVAQPAGAALSSVFGEQRLSVAQIGRDIGILKQAYAHIHPGYTRYTEASALDPAWNEIENQAVDRGGMTISEFYLKIQKVLTLIRCDHTKANLPPSMRKERSEKPYYLPFRWVWINDRAFVSITEGQIGLSKFDEILTIDGKTIGSLVDEVKEYIPYDGVTEWSRNSGISESLEFMGGAVDHFGALLWPISAHAGITYRSEDNQIRSIQVARINHKQWQQLATLENRAANFKDAVSYQRIGKDIALIRVDTFVNYRDPVDPREIYEPIFRSIHDEGRTAVILDLRDNGGGSTDASHGLFSYLTTKPTRLKLDMFTKTLDFDEFRPYVSTWDERMLDPWRIAFKKNANGTYSLRHWFTDELDKIEPEKYAFPGRIIALTSQSNSSGSTDLLSVLRATRDVTLIGEKTGGSEEGPTAGLLFTLTLPESGITTRIPVFQSINNVRGFERGLGLMPDIEVPMTVSAFRNAEDPALEAAISLLEIP